MAAALNEIGRIASLSQTQLHELYCGLWPALEHNYRTFIEGAPAEAGRILAAIGAAIG